MGMFSKGRRTVASSEKDRCVSLQSQILATKAERDKILQAIHGLQPEVEQAKAACETARAAVETEEYEAAQTGLAVASEGSNKALRKAELNLKSLTLRMRGLETKLSAANEQVVAAWGELQAAVLAFRNAQIEEYQAEFQATAAAFVALLRKGYALWLAMEAPEKFGMPPAITQAVIVFPGPGPKGRFMLRGGSWAPRDSEQAGSQMIWQAAAAWKEDEAACRASEAARQVTEAFASIRSVVQQIAPDRVK